jgi:hypothetical protein
MLATEASSYTVEDALHNKFQTSTKFSSMVRKENSRYIYSIRILVANSSSLE